MSAKKRAGKSAKDTISVVKDFDRSLADAEGLIKRLERDRDKAAGLCAAKVKRLERIRGALDEAEALCHKTDAKGIEVVSIIRRALEGGES